MTAPNMEATGGGVNYQCLPLEPQYDSSAPDGVYFSTLKAAFYLVSEHQKTLCIWTDHHSHNFSRVRFRQNFPHHIEILFVQ